MSRRRGGGVRLSGGPLDGETTKVPTSDQPLDIFPQPADPGEERDPDQTGFRYVAGDRGWVYSGTVTAREAEESARQAEQAAQQADSPPPGA